MDIITKAAAICVAASVIVLLIRKNSPELALLLATAAAVAVIAACSGAVSDIVASVKGIAEKAELDLTVLSILFKTVAVSVITRLSADVCRDGGQAAAASAVELCGAVSALYLALPLIEAAVKTVEELL